MMNCKLLLKVDELWKSYQLGVQTVHALKGISMEVNQGEFIAIMGASGSGKSTLLNILGCLDRPNNGSYFFKGINTTEVSNVGLSYLRRENFGFVFQSYNLLARTSAVENIELPLLYGTGLNKKQRSLLVDDALNKVGLSDKRNNKPNQLSGGQQQRVAIARAIVNSPSIIFADEPTGNLDTLTSYEILALFQQLNRSGTTIIIVTHEDDIAAFADRKILFKDGNLIADDRNEFPIEAKVEIKSC